MSANMDHHWEADTNGPKDDKDNITAFRKILSRYTLNCLPRLSAVEHTVEPLYSRYLWFPRKMSANLNHHWEADTNGPKDDKDNITTFRKILSRYTLHCLPRLSAVGHNSTLS